MNNKWFNMKAENKNVSIDIFGEIGDYGITAQSFKNELDKYSDYENITININSCGGAVFEGIAIYNMLKNNKAKVTVIVNGLAASIASTIAMAGDEIIMYDNSYLMIHLPYTMAMGTEKEMDKASEVLKNIKNDLVKIYQTKFNKSENELIAMLEAETWISGNDALEMGISNSVIEGLEIAAKFEFDKYNNVPADVKDLYAKKYSEFIKDEVKEDANQSIEQLRVMGIQEIIMLSGDKNSITQKIANALGITNAKGGLLPEDKLNELEAIKKDPARVVAFVGDGINDAPVLAVSDVGIAMGAMGSDVAIETADVIIQTDQLSKIITGIRIGKSTQRIIWQNIILAFTVKAIVLILGAGGLATMWEAVFADVGVALLAILNAVRLQRMEWK